MPKGIVIVVAIAPTGALTPFALLLFKLIYMSPVPRRIQARDASEKRAVEAEYSRQILWEQRSCRAQNFGWACG